MAHFGKIDSAIKDYLLSRGFNSSLRAFENELKGDKERQNRVDKIMETLHTYNNNLDLANLRDYWQLLEKGIFSHCEQVYSMTIRKLEVSLLKYYLVSAHQAGKPDAVREFFEKLGPELQLQPEWKDWFALPFAKNPEEIKVFALYFTKQWQDTLFLSLHNFLSVVMQSIPTPPLFDLDEDNKKVVKLHEENNRLKAKLAHLVEKSGTPYTEDDATATTPCGPPPGPGSLDLMDDFSVISQETNSAEKNPNMPKTHQIQSFLKNIGLPSSPILGKKNPPPQTPAPTTTNLMAPQQTAASTGKKDIKIKAVDAASRQKTKGAVTNPTDITSAESATQGHLQYSTEGLVSDQGPGFVEEPGVTASKGSGPVRQQHPLDGESAFLLLSQEEYSEHHSCVTHCCFSSSGQKMASADIDGVVKIWTPQPSPVTEATTMSKSLILALEWIPKCDRLLLGTKTGTIRLFDVKDKKTLKEVSGDPMCPRILSLSCSPQGTQFACAAAGRMRPLGGASVDQMEQGPHVGRLSLWDAKTMKIERQLSAGTTPVAVTCTKFNHNGQLMISGAADGNLRLYDVRKGECIASWPAHNGEIYNVAFSVDETSCFSMASDGKFIQWSLQRTGICLAVLPVHQGAAGPFVLTGVGGYRQVQAPKGKLFALDAEGTHVITCAQNGGCVYELNKDIGLKKSLFLGGHHTPVVCVDWSETTDCKMCASGSMDGKVKISTLLPH